ncbi:MAG TPA: hypothetical protein VEG39_10935 [Clostridia bacterium]|nr:hypothetical protein [Clostridia bacterium]
MEKQSTSLTVKQNQKMVMLGSNDAVIKMTPNGLITAVKAQVKLKKDELATVQGKTFPNAAGYYRINQVAGINFYMPEKLELPDGHVVVNPYPIIDPESSTIRKVWIRETGIGRNALGNIQVVTITLLYDIQIYFIETVMKKIKANKNAGRLCTERSLTEEEKRTGEFFKIDGSMGVWVNLGCMDIFDAVSAYTSDKKFAERKTQSVIERNIIKKITGITYLDSNGSNAAIPVTGWVDDLTPENIEKIAKAAQSGQRITELNGQKVEYDDTSGEISPEEAAGIVDEEEDRTPETEEQQQGEGTQGEAAGETEPPVDELQRQREELVQAKDMIGEAAFKKIVAKFKKPIEQFTAEDIEKAKKLINAAADNQEKGERF